MSEQRLIDADALMKDIRSYFFRCVNEHDSEIIDTYCKEILAHNKNISKIIKKAPTVERPRGEWIFYVISAQSKTGSIDETLYKCSNCGAVCNGKPRFCAGCYAEMRGEEE